LKTDLTTKESKEGAVSNDVESNDTTLLELNSEKSVKAVKAVDDDYEYIIGFKLILVTSAVTMVAFLITLDASIVVTVSLASSCLNTRVKHLKDQAIPSITTDFHSIPDIGWYGAAYLLAK
jgi:hypothetical protein